MPRARMVAREGAESTTEASACDATDRARAASDRAGRETETRERVVDARASAREGRATGAQSFRSRRSGVSANRR